MCVCMNIMSTHLSMNYDLFNLGAFKRETQEFFI